MDTGTMAANVGAVDVAASESPASSIDTTAVQDNGRTWKAEPTAEPTAEPKTEAQPHEEKKKSRRLFPNASKRNRNAFGLSTKKRRNRNRRSATHRLQLRATSGTDRRLPQKPTTTRLWNRKQSWTSIKRKAYPKKPLSTRLSLTNSKPRKRQGKLKRLKKPNNSRTPASF